MKSPLTTIHPSNLLTYLSLAAGLGAIAAALRGASDGAGACIAIAALADTFDGRFARRFARTRQQEAIGLELDSLVDGVSFGLVPVAATSILLATGDHRISVGWWIAAALYAGGALTRLAFYNVTNTPADDGGLRVAGGFIGVPVPAAALMWSTMLLAPLDARLAAVIALGTAVAMVAPLRIPRPRGTALLIFALWPVSLVIAHYVRHVGRA